MSYPDSTILHIGYPKTGTSWFQNEFFPHVDNIYFYKQNDLPESIFNDISEINISNILEHFKRKDKRIVISAEKLVGNIRNMYKNPQKYKHLFPDAEIIIFIRNQIDKFASNYSHHILMGGTCSINEFLFPDNKSNLFNGQKHRYDKLIECYKSIFGNKHVHIFIYEEFRDIPEQFTQDFAKSFHLSYNPEKIKFDKLVNRRLSIVGIRLLRILNHFTRNVPAYHRKSKIRKDFIFHIPYWNEITSKIIYTLNNKGLIGRKISTEKILGEKNMNFLKEYFAESNRNLIQYHKLDIIKKYNYPI
ncbi:MAG: hypothetical protein AMS27_10735 [Bacteroides sp. SM23_62_1]|nr:MAG: hypothetical protein AMS27_10735 [Bacteroides sp. SM23_62_1]